MSIGVWEIPFRNNSGETIPAFGVIRCSDSEAVEGRTVIIAEKPNTYGSQYLHFFNGPIDVPAGGYGSCTSSFPALAKFNSGSFSTGDLVGPVDDSWSLDADSRGFVVVGVSGGGGALVVNRLPMLAFTGRFNATVAKGATEDVSVYVGGIDTGYDIADVLAVSDGFGTSDNVNCTLMNGVWEAYCRD